MATVAIVLRKHKQYTKGLYPLAVRITINRTSAYTYLGHFIKETDWDRKKQCVKKSHQHSKRLNASLLRIRSKFEDHILKVQQEKAVYTAKYIIASLENIKQKVSFFDRAEEYLRELHTATKVHQYKADKSRIKYFREFVGRDNLLFEDITVSLLKKFALWLKDKRSVNERTTLNYLVVIRTLYNRAIRDGIVDREHYPFGRHKISISFPKSMKIGLNREEVQLLEDVTAEHSYEQWHARNVWLVSFYLAGIRAGDLLQLKKTDIIDGRLYYTMGKNNKVVSLKLPEKAKHIIDYYTDKSKSTDIYIFPELNRMPIRSDHHLYQRINTCKKNLNDRLKLLAKRLGIKKNISMHIARHTFGNLAGDTIPITMLQQLYRHSHISTTVDYQSNFIFKDKDEALESVIG